MGLDKWTDGKIKKLKKKQMQSLAPGEEQLHAAVPAAVCLYGKQLCGKGPESFPTEWEILMGRMENKDNVP